MSMDFAQGVYILYVLYVLVCTCTTAPSGEMSSEMSWS